MIGGGEAQGDHLVKALGTAKYPRTRLPATTLITLNNPTRLVKR